MTKNKILIMMGSESDADTMKGAGEILREFSVAFDMKVLSAHRAPEEFFALAGGLEDSEYKLVIGGAGLAAHLPGMLAALTSLPVIGVPIPTGPLAGVDALHSILQMPPGSPVATVGIGNSRNAALLAIRMWAMEDTAEGKRLRQALKDYKSAQKEKIVRKPLLDSFRPKA